MTLGAYAKDADHLWLAEQKVTGSPSLTIWRTVDGGSTWLAAELDLPLRVARVEIDFVTEEDGWLLASAGPALGQMRKALFHTIDGGNSWQLVTCGCPDKGVSYAKWMSGGMYTTGMAFGSGSTGWVTGSYHGDDALPVYRTEDGGQSWKPQELPLDLGVRQAAYGNGVRPLFFDQERANGVLPVGLRSGLEYTIVLFATKDGGRTWDTAGEVEAPRCGSGSSVECQVAVVDSAHFWVVQRGGPLLQTSDGGKTWRQLSPGLELVSVSFGSATHGLGLAREGQDQILVQTDDGGSTWVPTHAELSPRQ